MGSLLAASISRSSGQHKMTFGLFYQHQLPRPWTADSEHRLLHEALAKIELADALGYDDA